MRVFVNRRTICLTTLLGFLGACSDQPVAPGVADIDRAASRVSPRVQCDADNGGITLPEGFCAVVVADLVMNGRPALARHMAVLPTGEIFVAINSPRNNQPQFGVIGLRDTNGDGKADEQSRFSPGLGGSGIAYNSGL